MNEEFNNVSAYQEPSSNGEEGKGMAVASMVCGIIAIVLSCIWYVSFICGIVAIVLGILYNKKNGKCGMTTAGIVCGVIGMILAIVIIVIAALGLVALGSAAALY